MAVGRWLDTWKDRWLPEWRRVSVRNVDESQLRGRVVFIQTLVIRALQQVFVSSNWSRPAGALLRIWLIWHGRLAGRGAARSGHELDQQRAIIRHPRQGAG